MKKLLAIMLAGALMFSFAGCKSDEEKALDDLEDAVNQALGDLAE